MADTELLARNLQALDAANPVLAQRLCWPVSSEHVRHDEDHMYYRWHLSEEILDLPQSRIDSLLSLAPEDRPCFVFGMGLGEITAALAAQRQTPIVAWDRDPWMLRLALSQHDFSLALRSGQLSLTLSADIVSLADELRTAERRLDDLSIVPHPLLGRVYQRELDLLSNPSFAPLALLGAGGLLVDDLARSLQAEGYRVFTVDFSQLSREELDWTADHFQPALIATINYPAGLAEFAAHHQIPLISWEIDPVEDLPRPPECNTENARLFTYRRANVDALRNVGFTHVDYLPIAANPETRHPVDLTNAERIQWGSDVSFVGSSLEFERRNYEAKYYMQISRSSLGSAEWGKDLLDAALGEQQHDWSHYQVPQIFDRLAPTVVPFLRRNLARYAGEIASAERRRQFVKRLLPYGIKVWGDEGWSDAVGSSYQGAAGHFRELNHIYCGSKINLDVNRLNQNDIVPIRIFDILATGAFVLADYSPALEELFEIGSEIDCYRTPDEMETKVVYYLEHPDHASTIASRGRAAVLARHTVRQRVQHMLAQVEARAH